MEDKPDSEKAEESLDARYERMEKLRLEILEKQLEDVQIAVQRKKELIPKEDEIFERQKRDDEERAADRARGIQIREFEHEQYMRDSKSAVAHREWIQKYLKYETWMSTYRAYVNGALSGEYNPEHIDEGARDLANGLHGPCPEMPE